MRDVTFEIHLSSYIAVLTINKPDKFIYSKYCKCISLVHNTCACLVKHVFGFKALQICRYVFAFVSQQNYVHIQIHTGLYLKSISIKYEIDGDCCGNYVKTEKKVINPESFVIILSLPSYEFLNQISDKAKKVQLNHRHLACDY